MNSRPRQILFAGHSLIEYFDWQARFPESECNNLGVAGETTQGLLSRTTGIVSRFPDADIVFVMTGINNLAFDDRDLIPSYRQVIRSFKRGIPRATIYIHSLLPVSFEFISNETIREVNWKLEELAGEEGVFYLDIHRLFSDDKGDPRHGLLLDDGVHLTDEGYRVWSGALENLLR